MRLFIAIELPKSFRAEVARLQSLLQAQSLSGRFVPLENFHITLHFIGESTDLAGAAQAMELSLIHIFVRAYSKRNLCTMADRLGSHGLQYLSLIHI